MEEKNRNITGKSIYLPIKASTFNVYTRECVYNLHKDNNKNIFFLAW
jgi:hypothetical protein